MHLEGRYKGHIIPPRKITESEQEKLERRNLQHFTKCTWNKGQMKRLGGEKKKFVNGSALVTAKIADVRFLGERENFPFVTLHLERVQGQEKSITYHINYFLSLLGILFGFIGSIFVICLLGQLVSLILLIIYISKNIYNSSKFAILFTSRYIRSQKDRVLAAKEKFTNATNLGWDSLQDHISGINIIISLFTEEIWRLLVNRIQDIHSAVIDPATILRDFKYRLKIDSQEFKNMLVSFSTDTDAFNAAFNKFSLEAQEFVRIIGERGELILDELMINE